MIGDCLWPLLLLLVVVEAIQNPDKKFRSLAEDADFFPITKLDPLKKAFEQDEDDVVLIKNNPGKELDDLNVLEGENIFSSKFQQNAPLDFSVIQEEAKEFDHRFTTPSSVEIEDDSFFLPAPSPPPELLEEPVKPTIAVVADHLVIPVPEFEEEDSSNSREELDKLNSDIEIRAEESSPVDAPNEADKQRVKGEEEKKEGDQGEEKPKLQEPIVPDSESDATRELLESDESTPTVEVTTTTNIVKPHNETIVDDESLEEDESGSEEPAEVPETTDEKRQFQFQPQMAPFGGFMNTLPANRFSFIRTAPLPVLPPMAAQVRRPLQRQRLQRPPQPMPAFARRPNVPLPKAPAPKTTTTTTEAPTTTTEKATTELITEPAPPAPQPEKEHEIASESNGPPAMAPPPELMLLIRKSWLRRRKPHGFSHQKSSGNFHRRRQ